MSEADYDYPVPYHIAGLKTKLLQTVYPSKVIVHIRYPLLVVRLVILAPFSKFLLGRERTAPAPTAHYNFNLRSQDFNEVSDRPALPYMLVHIDCCHNRNLLNVLTIYLFCHLNYLLSDFPS